MPRYKGRAAGLAVTLGVLAGLAGSGCSFMFVDAPPDNARSLTSVQALECTGGNGWPTTDVIVGGIMALETFATLSESSSLASSGNASSAYVVPAVAAAGAALFVASGVSGYRHTSECRQAKREVMTREFPGGPPGMPPRGFAPGFAPYPPMAPPPPPYDPWSAQPAPTAAPPRAAPPAALEPGPPAPAPVPPTPPPAAGTGGGW
jgi:hypothetical protein